MADNIVSYCLCDFRVHRDYYNDCVNTNYRALWQNRLCQCDSFMKIHSRMLFFTNGIETVFVIFKASALWADAFYKLKCPYICVSVCVFVCLFTFEVPFNGLFAPTSQSRMSNIFRDSESLGKSNWKKWSHIWTI